MVEVVRAEDREAEVNADRKKGRKSNEDFAKRKTKTGNLNKDRKKRRRYLAKTKWDDSQNQSHK